MALSVKIVILGEGKFLFQLAKSIPWFKLCSLLYAGETRLKDGFIHVKAGSPFELDLPVRKFVANLLFLDAARVGKTSLLKRYVMNQFDSAQVSTIDATFLEKKLQVGS